MNLTPGAGVKGTLYSLNKLLKLCLNNKYIFYFFVFLKNLRTNSLNRLFIEGVAGGNEGAPGPVIRLRFSVDDVKFTFQPNWPGKASTSNGLQTVRILNNSAIPLAESLMNSNTGWPAGYHTPHEIDKKILDKKLDPGIGFS